MGSSLSALKMGLWPGSQLGCLQQMDQYQLTSLSWMLLMSRYLWLGSLWVIIISHCSICCTINTFLASLCIELVLCPKSNFLFAENCNKTVDWRLKWNNSALIADAETGISYNWCQLVILMPNSVALNHAVKTDIRSYFELHDLRVLLCVKLCGIMMLL